MSDNVLCPLCKSLQAEIFIQTHDRLLELPGDFTYMRCRGCGLVYLHPRPDWTVRAAHYASTYRGYHRLETESSALQQRSMRYGLGKRYRLVAAHIQNGRLLDAGCGGGDFLAYVREHGSWKVFGLERARNMAQAAHRHYQLDIITGDLMQPAFSQASFDVLTLWTVLEHLPDPLQALSTCAALLRPGGLLVLRTVHIDSWGARLFGPCWVGFDAPRVLCAYSRGVLTQILEQTGFEVISIKSYFHDYHPYLWSLDNLCRQRLGDHAILYRLLNGLASSWLARIFSYPYFALQTRLGMNGYITALARKP